MLEIKVKKLNVDLPSDISIAMTVENPMMVEERLPIPYSLAFDLPMTPRNLQIFGYPNRIGAHLGDNLFKTYSCQIYFQGILIHDGTVNLVSCENTIKVNFKGVDFNENLDVAMFSKDVGEVQFAGNEGIYDFDNTQSYFNSYKNWATGLAYNTNPNYIAAPIHVRTTNNEYRYYQDEIRSYYDRVTGLTYRSSLTNPPILELQKQYLNCFNPSLQNFYFKDSSNSDQAHGIIFPIFRMKYLIDKLIGSNLIESPFETTALRDILIPTFYLKNLFVTWSEPKPITSSPLGELPAYLTLSECLPNINANKFLQMILNLFCLTLVAHKGKFIVKENKEVFAQPVKADWSTKLQGVFNKSKQDAQYYDYGFEDPKYYAEENVTFTEVATHEAMQAKEFNLTDHDDSYSETFLITSTQEIFIKSAYYQYYIVQNVEGYELVIGYDFKGYKKPKAKTESGEKNKFNAKSDIKQLYLSPAVYWNSLNDDPLSKKFWLVPKWDPENMQDIAVRNVRQTYLSLLVYSGNRTIGTKTYPFLSPYGNANISLSWDGPDGLIEQYHKEFKNWIEKPRLKGSGVFLLTALELNRLSITDKVHLDGRNFYIEKLQYTIRRDRIDPVVADLIEV
ncbi:hypothetical protein [Sphingobacterium sp. HSC-15S19]|uniref:hypothetical protein n=1 Tax=Sphingobacterium sp. HSC-15S19 TaxID=2910971 RepID=UPI003D1D1C08